MEVGWAGFGSAEMAEEDLLRMIQCEQNLWVARVPEREQQARHWRDWVLTWDGCLGRLHGSEKLSLEDSTNLFLRCSFPHFWQVGVLTWDFWNLLASFSPGQILPTV